MSEISPLGTSPFGCDEQVKEVNAMIVTKKAIATALGITPAAFSRYASRGCPVDSIEAARAWQAANVSPWQRIYRDERRRYESAPKNNDL